MGEGYTVGEAVERAAEHFGKHGIEEGRRTAQLLLQHLLGADMAELLGSLEEKLSSDQQTRYSALVRRRTNREPLQYITRRVEFWSLEFYVDPRAVIPRPETEHIVEEVLADFPDRDAGLRIADVCTGSGVLAIVLAREYPKAGLLGIDIEPGALEVAAINASRLNVSGRVKFLRSNLFSREAGLFRPESMDIIVSNPPYISAAETAALPPEISRAEPRRAHVAGPTGLELFQRLIPQADFLLTPGGRLYLECGAGQAKDVARLLETHGMRHSRTAPDLQRIPRVVVGESRRQP